MRFKINIETDNAALADDGESEIVRILRKIANRIEEGERDGLVHDINGNRVGHWDVLWTRAAKEDVANA